MYPGSCVWLVYRYLLQGLVVVDTAEVELMDLEEWFLVKVLLLLSWILLEAFVGKVCGFHGPASDNGHLLFQDLGLE